MARIWSRLFVALLVCLLVLSLAAYARGGNDGGGADNVRGGGNGHLEVDSTPGPRASPKVSVGPARTPLGRLIREAEQARRETLRETREGLRELGYRGPMHDFVHIYNNFTNRLKAAIRRKLNLSVNYTDDEMNITSTAGLNWSRELVRAIALRELARVREERIATLNLTVNDTELKSGMDALEEETGENLTAGEHSVAWYRLRNATMEFRQAVRDVMQNGTPQEKRALARQLRRLAQRVRDAAHERSARRIEGGQVDADRLRDMLRRNATGEDIEGALEED